MPIALVSCAAAVSFDEYNPRGAPPSSTDGGAADVEDAAPRAHIKQVAAGAKHTCALLDNGEVRCWGDNEFGQLGDGTTINRAAPTGAVRGVTNASAISAGDFHTCALVTNGGIMCWGLNWAGQLGDGTTSLRTEAVLVRWLSSATAVSTGATFSCAIVANGAVYCWGSNRSGELASAPLGSEFVSPIAVGGISGATAIASSTIFSCAIVANGEVRCWGGGTNAIRFIDNLYGATVLVTSHWRGCAIVTNGDVLCFNPFDQTSQAAAAVSGIAGATAIANSSFMDHDLIYSRVCAAVANGTVWCSGPGTDPTPVPVDGLRPSIGLATGGEIPDDHTCAVLVGGTEVRCWGSNKYGQLGDGTLAATNVATPVAVMGLR